MMPNLHDVLTVTKPSALKVAPETLKAISGLTEGLKQSFDFRKMLYAPRMPKGDLPNVIEMVNKRLDEIRSDIFAEHHCLPQNLIKPEKYYLRDTWSRGENYELGSQNEADPMTLLCQTPKVQLADLRKVANKLCMIIMPYEFLHKAAFRGEPWDIEAQAKNFNKTASAQKMKVYVICPPRYYSIEKHVESKSAYAEIYAGSQQMIFNSVAINIPMFRTIITDLAEMRDRVNTIGAKIAAVESNIAVMQQQIISLERDMERTRREALEAKIEAAAARAETTEARRAMEFSFVAADPMMVAFPSDKDINDDSSAFVGPAWGPDFENILCELNDLAVVKGQRTKLNVAMQTLYQSVR